MSNKYMLKEKFLGWGNDFQILDGSGNPVYFVDGEAWSWGDKLSFQDLAGRELAFINQKVMSWKPRYEIHRGGQQLAEVVQEFSWLNKKFTLDVPGPNDYTITGSFWRHDYQFSRGGRVVAEVTSRGWGFTDCYGIEIVDGEDDIAILCTAVVIDQILCDKND